MVSLRRQRLILLFVLALLFLFTLLLLAPRPTLARDLSGGDASAPITADATWTAGVYTATNCSVTVPAGITLTLESGVIVKFGGNTSGLRVDGTLIANGTAAQPVIVTSMADDSAGGDTNGDGASSGAPGDWYGLYLAPGSRADLDHTSFRFGGDDYAFNNSLYGWSRSQIDVRDAHLSLTNSEVISGAANGIYLDGEGLTPVIQNVRVADHTNPADTYSLDYALYQSSVNMQPSYANLTFTGNARNEVTIGNWRETLTQDVTLGGTNFGAICGYTVCQLTVPDGRTLTVQPGTLLDMRSSYGIAIGDGGSLIAQGTATQPITFTSSLAAAGETGQYWYGMHAQQGSELRLDHCDISYADDGNFGSGGLEINTNDAQVNNCKIHHNRRTGLHLESPSSSTIHPQFTNVDVTDNGETGVQLQASNGSSLAVDWEGGSISRNGWSGFSDQTSFSTVRPSLRNVTISDNGSQGTNDDRQRGISFDNHGVHPVLENVRLTGNSGAAVYWFCNGSITADSLTATGNGADEIQIPGCALGGGQQWDLGGAAIPVRVTGDIEVTTNGLLTIQPGTTLIFDKNQYGSSTGLAVQSQAALYALGTADKPIVFTGATQTPGAWKGIIAYYDRTAVILDHCEVAYGGDTTHGNLSFYGNSAVSPSPVQVQNCDIHDSSKKGIFFDWVWTQPPTIKFNQIHDNTEEGMANWNAPALDARQNWWGHASGPYHETQNPSGTGGTVGDNVLFYPWQGAPQSGQTAGDLLVSTGGPLRFSPGQTVDYAVQYLNQMTTTVENATVMVRLPHLSSYVDSSDGGVYWPERHQVFWHLGDVAPGAQGQRALTVQFDWGIPGNQTDNMGTLLVADNFNPGVVDRTPYAAYSALSAQPPGPMTESEWASTASGQADLNTLNTQALADGYLWSKAERVSLSNGDTVAQAILIQPDQRRVRILYGDPSRPYAVTFWAGGYQAEDVTGGVRWDIPSNTRTFFGDWVLVNRAGEELFGPRGADACEGAGCCLSNCLSKVALTAVAGKLSSAVNTALTTQQCYVALKTQTQSDLLKCAGAIKEGVLKVNNVPVLGELIGITECLAQCSGDPNSNDCTGDLITCESAWSNLYDYLGVPSKTVWRCQGGCYSPKPEYLPCAFGDCCMPGAGCVSGSTAGGNCQKSRYVPAKDPNEIAGPSGDLLPGQTVTYTVSYENEGAGRAYGVFVVNPLSPVFDEASLDLHGQGRFITSTREILWTVGELGPKGDADSTGAFTYTIALSGTLPSGTVVSNQAVVYFSSVPEETPTNTWVNLVSPLVADPQELSTDYITALPVTLSGREASNLPFTYEIVDPPHGGILTGTPPDLTYTPGEDFTGADSFSFRVDNGMSQSRAAQVSITVNPAGDSTAPAVLWTSPEADATGISTSATPVFTDTAGTDDVPVYTPVILIGVSEALSETTVTTATVTLSGPDGGPSGRVPVGVRFDGATNQIVVSPHASLASGLYTVTVSTGVTDLAGNGLATPYTLTFTVGEESGEQIFLPDVQK